LPEGFTPGTFRLGRTQDGGVEKLLGFPCPGEVETEVILSTVLARITCPSLSFNELK